MLLIFCLHHVGFARTAKELPVTFALTGEIKEKIAELFRHCSKMSAACMRKILVAHFPHPRDHPAEVQIQSQITALLAQKKAQRQLPPRDGGVAIATAAPS